MVEMPAGAEVLCVQTQRGQPFIWARVNPNATTSPRKFRTFGTMHPIDPSTIGKYVGTYQLEGGSLIFHVFESS